MKSLLLSGAAALALCAAPALASESYTLDSSHSQIVFSYDHLGFSTTYGMFSGFEGQIQFNAEDPAASAVNVSFPVKTMFTGWEKRDAHLFSADFFDAADDEMISFASTSIEVTGENTALITGDLTVNGVTKAVVLDTVMNQSAEHPMAKQPWLGFDATTTLVRSEFGLGAFAPFVGDEISVTISIEAMQAQ